MNFKSVIINIVLAIIILEFILGQQYLPSWVWISLFILSIAGLVFFLAKLFFEEKVSFMMRLADLETLQKKDTSELSAQSQKQCDTLLKTMSNNHELISQQIKDAIESLREEYKKGVSAITDKVKEETATINDEYDKQKVALAGIRSLMQESSSSITELINSNTSKIKQQSAELLLNIKEANETIKHLISSTTQSLQDVFVDQISILKTNQESLIENLKMVHKEQNDNLLKKIDSVSLQVEKLDTCIKVIRENLKEETSNIKNLVDTSGKDLEKQLVSSEIKLKEDMTLEISKTATNLLGSIESSRMSVDSMIKKIEMSNKEQSEAFLQNINSVSSNIASLQKTIGMTITELVEKSDTIEQTIKLSYENIKAQQTKAEKIINESILNNGSIFTAKMKKIEESLSKAIDDSSKDSENRLADIQAQIESIELQNKEASSLTLNTIKNSDRIAEAFYYRAEEHSSNIHKTIDTVLIQNQNIEKAVNFLSADKNEERIKQSLQAVVSDIKSEIHSTFTEVNNQILDAKGFQQHINNELEKLQILLRSMSIGGDTNKDIKSVKTDSNHIETIVDAETQNIVQNEYANNHLVKSVMKDSKGNIIYELDYMNDKVTRSKNYDSEGRVNNEQIFYENGQVHYRYEYGKNGKIVSEFDINGNKK